MSTRPIKIGERDLKILMAMKDNLNSFIRDAEKKAATDESNGKKVLDVEVTVIIEPF